MKFKPTRHLIISIVFLILAFAAGAGMNQLWHNQVVHDKAVAASIKAANDLKAHEQARKDQAAKEAFKKECDKQVADYAALTPIQKKTKEAPACQNLEFVQ